MTLYELTKLEDQQFAARIERSIIRPDMERLDLAPLRTGFGRGTHQVAARICVNPRS